MRIAALLAATAGLAAHFDAIEPLLDALDIGLGLSLVILGACLMADVAWGEGEPG